ncbi:stromelysin-2-like [Temnothorax curvispinosus]|uniref:Stromelysin-2-like n=1 Tax=Temnothorax curvispinosus TaxID=300111 RepID=A0A6J1R4I4_9HYME|nr:stromelysin-2-like [Temnothorax curvispinosus]
METQQASTAQDVAAGVEAMEISKADDKAEFHRLSGDGELNEETLNRMRKPRCGVEDISERTFAPLSDKWPKKHLKWNFHLANDLILKTTRAAFDLWAANSSLTFEHNLLNPDILISFQVHVDKTETWHIQLNENPPGTYNLLYTLTHEIGHALGLPHTFHKDSVMYTYVPDDAFPVQLSLEDVLSIQHLYGAKKNVNFPKLTTTTPATTTTTIPTTTTTATKDVETDLCT